MTDWEKINQEIENADSIMLTTHENPDGDGIGSIMALASHLKTRGRKYRILLPSKLPDEFEFIDPDNKIEIFDLEKHSDWISQINLAILLDIGNYTRTGQIWGLINQNDTKIVNIDHHPYTNGHPFTLNVFDVKASATGELIYSYLKAIDPDSFTKEIYAAIYVAVMTDTGSFSYNNTNVICHEIASKAIEYGVDTAKLHQNIYGSSSRSKIKLLAAVANNIQYTYDGKLAWFKITSDMMATAGAVKDDVDGFTDFARSITGVEVSLMIFENSDGTCRINFRSKGSYTINKIARDFGGGGHEFAAGAKVTGKIADIASKVVEKTITEMTVQEKVNN